MSTVPTDTHMHAGIMQTCIYTYTEIEKGSEREIGWEEKSRNERESLNFFFNGYF